MLRNIIKLAICGFWANQLLAMEDAKEDPTVAIKKSYASHPAASYTGEPYLNNIVAEMVIEIGSLLDRHSVGAYFRTCKYINKQRIAISVLFIPELYKLQNLEFRNAFFQLDHPQWTPDKLSAQDRWKLHYQWFLTGHKIPMPVGDNWTHEEKAAVLKKMRLLYSAASCAHEIAAEDVGGMLLDPRCNDVLPVVVSMDDLESGLRGMDARRLHRDQTENEELAQFLKELELMDTDSDDDDEKPFDEKSRARVIKKFETSLQKIAKISDTPEVKVVKAFLMSFLMHLKEGGNPNNYKPTEPIALAKALYVNTPLINDLLNQEEDRGTSSDDSLLSLRANFLCALNTYFIIDYAQALLSQVQTRTPFEGQTNSFEVKFKTTEEARQTMQLVRQLQRVNALLGGEEHPYLHSMMCCIDPIDIGRALTEIKPKEDCIHVFLYHLALSRNPTI